VDETGDQKYGVEEDKGGVWLAYWTVEDFCDHKDGA